MATRPHNVPDFAIEIPPAAWYPQAQTTVIQQFVAAIVHENATNSFNYMNYYHDWQTNNSIYQSLGMVGPPLRPAPAVAVANVVWADPAGNVHTVQAQGDSAWIWET